MKNKMENIYKTISGKARKYVASVIVAGALTLGSYAAEAKTIVIPEVFKETRAAMQAKAEEFRGLEESVLQKYNAVIADRNFSVEEQNRVYSEIKELQKYALKGNLNVSEGISNLEKGLQKNLEGVDWGKPELQKAFEENGLGVSVDAYETKADRSAQGSLIASIVAPLVLGAVITIAYLEEKQKKR